MCVCVCVCAPLTKKTGSPQLFRPSSRPFLFFLQYISHRIHVCFFLIYMYQPNAGPYTNPMDPSWVFLLSLCAHHNLRRAFVRVTDFFDRCSLEIWGFWARMRSLVVLVELCERRSFTTLDGRNPANQLIGTLFHYLQGFFTSQVVQDFLYQQYVLLWCFSIWVFPKIGGKLPPSHPWINRVFLYKPSILG